MDFKIEKINSIKDIDKAAEIVSTALQEDFPTYKKETILAYRRGLFSKKGFRKFFKNKENIMLGAYDGNLIGFIGLKTEYGGVIFIDWLAVKKGFRGKGIGGTLLQHAEKWALANKFHYLYLFTETAKNMEFYKKRGFTYVGTHSKSWFGEDEHVLAKVLRSQPFKEIFYS